MGAFCVFGWLKEDIQSMENRIAQVVKRRQERLKRKVLPKEFIDQLSCELRERFMSKLRKKPCSPEFDSPQPCANYIDLLKKHQSDVVEPEIFFRGKLSSGEAQKTWAKYEWQQKTTQQSIVKAVGKRLVAHA